MEAGRGKMNLFTCFRQICTRGDARAPRKRWLGVKSMEIATMYFVVESIDGDYANLCRTDKEMGESKLVARALLPAEITEGTRLKYEMLQYEMIDG